MSPSPEWIVPCYVVLPREPMFPPEALVLTVGSAVATAAALGLATTGAHPLLIVAVPGALAGYTVLLGLRIWQWKRSHAFLFADRLELRHPRNRHPPIHLDFTEVTALVRLDRRRILVQRGLKKPVELRLPTIQAEDLFDTLAEHITVAQPDCAVREP